MRIIFTEVRCKMRRVMPNIIDHPPGEVQTGQLKGDVLEFAPWVICLQLSQSLLVWAHL